MSHLPPPLSLGPNEVGRPAPLPLNDGPPRPPRPPVMLGSCSFPHVGKAPVTASSPAVSLKDVSIFLCFIFSHASMARGSEACRSWQPSQCHAAMTADVRDCQDCALPSLAFLNPKVPGQLAILLYIPFFRTAPPCTSSPPSCTYQTRRACTYGAERLVLQRQQYAPKARQPDRMQLERG